MNRDELHQANEALLERRRKEKQRRGDPESTEVVLSSKGFDVDEKPEQPNDRYKDKDAHVIQGSSELWDSFDTDVHPKADVVKKRVSEWLKHGVPAGKSMIIEGNCGVGKTHIGRAIAQAYPYVPRYGSMFGDNLGAMFVNEVDFVEQCKSTWGNYTRDQSEIVERLMVPHILVFDDLGAYKVRNEDWLTNIYYQIFDGRCENGRACLFLTNMGVDKNSGFGILKDRIQSRNYDRLMGAVAIRKEHKIPMLGEKIGEYREEMLEVESVRTGTIYTTINKIKKTLKKGKS